MGRAQEYLAGVNWDAHGWLIAAVCLYLLCAVAPRLPAPRRPTVGALLVLGLLLGLLMLASYAHVDLAQQLLLPLMPVALAGTVYGVEGARRVAFPCLYLWFAVPVWDALVPVLQHTTVIATGYALSWLGIPASIDGDLVRVPAGLFEIAGGCSGEHFFVVALAISTLYSYLREDGAKRVLGSLVLALALALVTNWVRVLVVIVRGNATQMHWPSYPRPLLVWLGIVRGSVVALLHAVALVGARGRPCARHANHDRYAQQCVRTLYVLPGTILMALVTGWGYLHAQGWRAMTPPDLTAPRSTIAFNGPLLADLDFRPVFPNAASERVATYEGRGGRVGYYKVAYAEQHVGQKLIGYGASVVPEGWQVSAARIAIAPLYAARPTGVRVNDLELVARSGERWRVWFWYDIGGHVTPSPLWARGWQALQLFGALRPATLTAIASPCRPDCTVAQRNLYEFTANAGRDLSASVEAYPVTASRRLASNHPTAGTGGSANGGLP